MVPPRSRSTLERSLSTQTTSLPRSAKTAPVTSPTYPVPTTQMFIGSPRGRYRIADGRRPSREGVTEEALAHHREKEQEQVEVREEKERQPAALVVGPARELVREPDEACAERGGGGEGDRSSDAEGRRGQGTRRQAESVEEDEARRPLHAHGLRHHGEAARRVVRAVAQRQGPEVRHLP